MKASHVSSSIPMAIGMHREQFVFSRYVLNLIQDTRKGVLISKLKGEYLLRKRLPHPIPMVIGIGFAKTRIINNH